MTIFEVEKSIAYFEKYCTKQLSEDGPRLSKFVDIADKALNDFHPRPEFDNEEFDLLLYLVDVQYKLFRTIKDEDDLVNMYLLFEGYFVPIVRGEVKSLLK